MPTIPKHRKQLNRTLTKVIMKYAKSKPQRKEYRAMESIKHEPDTTEKEISDNVILKNDKSAIENSHFFYGLCNGSAHPSEFPKRRIA